MKFNFSSKEELTKFIAEEIINSSEAMAILGGSRANLKDQVDRGKLIPIKEMAKDRLFYRSDVLARKKEIDEWNSKKK